MPDRAAHTVPARGLQRIGDLGQAALAVLGLLDAAEFQLDELQREGILRRLHPELDGSALITGPGRCKLLLKQRHGPAEPRRLFAVAWQRGERQRHVVQPPQAAVEQRAAAAALDCPEITLPNLIRRQVAVTPVPNELGEIRQVMLDEPMEVALERAAALEVEPVRVREIQPLHVPAHDITELVQIKWQPPVGAHLDHLSDDRRRGHDSRRHRCDTQSKRRREGNHHDRPEKRGAVDGGVKHAARRQPPPPIPQTAQPADVVRVPRPSQGVSKPALRQFAGGGAALHGAEDKLQKLRRGRHVLRIVNDAEGPIRIVQDRRVGARLGERERGDDLPVEQLLAIAPDGPPLCLGGAVALPRAAFQALEARDVRRLEVPFTDHHLTDDDLRRVDAVFLACLDLLRRPRIPAFTGEDEADALQRVAVLHEAGHELRQLLLRRHGHDPRGRLRHVVEGQHQAMLERRGLEKFPDGVSRDTLAQQVILDQLRVLLEMPEPKILGNMDAPFSR